MTDLTPKQLATLRLLYDHEQTHKGAHLQPRISAAMYKPLIAGGYLVLESMPLGTFLFLTLKGRQAVEKSGDARK